MSKIFYERLYILNKPFHKKTCNNKEQVLEKKN